MHASMIPYSILLTVIVLILSIQVSNAQIQVYTRGSSGNVNRLLQDKELQMLVVTVVANETQQHVDYIYLAVWEELLFLKPYFRLYTLRTITQKIKFATLVTMPGIVQEFEKEKRSDNNSLSNYALAMLNETSVLEYKPNPKYDKLKLCTLIGNGGIEHLYPDYFCLNLLNNSTQVVSPSSSLNAQDAILSLLQISCVIAATYYINLKLYHIRRAGKHRYVADTLFNPPYWPHILPWISRKTKTNFRLWDSLWMGFIFCVIYFLSIFSAFVPLTWPLRNQEPYIANLKRSFGGKEIRFLLFICFVIIVNLVTTINKIYKNAAREKHVELPLTFSRPLKVVSYIASFLISCISTATITLIMMFVFPEDFNLVDQIGYGLSLSIFAIVITVYFCKKSVVSVNNWIYQRVFLCYGKANSKERKQDFDNQYQLLQSDLEKKKYPVSTVLIFFTMLGSWIITAMWNTSLIILCFRASKVISKLFAATLANILVNTEIITTYSYILSIIGVLWKFFSDIERPYLHLKNMIAKERGSFNLIRIKAINKWLMGQTLNEMKSNLFLLKENYFLMPLKWTTFSKLAEMTHLHRLTRRILSQMLVTLFALCLFWIVSNSYDTQFFSKIADQSLVALIAGTLMPLIPRMISNFSDPESGIESTIFNERLKNSLKLLERKAENNTKMKFDWQVPSAYAPFRFTVVSVVKEPGSQADDDDDDTPLLFSEESDIPLKTMEASKNTDMNNLYK